MRNTYLGFMGALRVFHKYFEGLSWSFHDCFHEDSNVSALCFKGVLGCFYQTRMKLHFCDAIEIEILKNGRQSGSYSILKDWIEK